MIRPYFQTANGSTALAGEDDRLNPAFVRWLMGFPGRVATLRGFGNALVPQLAAEFVEAYLESLDQ